MPSESAHPLYWPSSQPRTRWRDSGPFRQTLAQARDHLCDELDRLGAELPILSTNLALRLDGLPRSGQAPPTDPGAAVYFTLNGKRIVLACDRWDTVAANVRAIGKHVEAMRGQERWGVGTRAQAFKGYQALPEEAGARPWRQVLGFGPDHTPDVEAVRSAYRRLAAKLDQRLEADERPARELHAARAAALEELGT